MVIRTLRRWQLLGGARPNLAKPRGYKCSTKASTVCPQDTNTSECVVIYNNMPVSTHVIKLRASSLNQLCTCDCEVNIAYATPLPSLEHAHLQLNRILEAKRGSNYCFSVLSILSLLSILSALAGYLYLETMPKVPRSSGRGRGRARGTVISLYLLQEDMITSFPLTLLIVDT